MDFICFKYIFKETFISHHFIMTSVTLQSDIMSLGNDVL